MSPMARNIEKGVGESPHIEAAERWFALGFKAFNMVSCQNKLIHVEERRQWLAECEQRGPFVCHVRLGLGVNGCVPIGRADRCWVNVAPAQPTPLRSC